MKRLGNWLGTIILGLVLLVLMIFMLLPVLFSGRVAVVLSGSMEPIMPVGALAITMPVSPEEIREGDIIAFTTSWTSDITVSHRVVGVITDEQLIFRTKGDANEDPDPWVTPAENVTGRVVYNIPHLGYVTDATLSYSRTRWGFAFLVVLPSMLLIGSAIRDATRLGDRRQQRMQTWLKRRHR